MLSLEFVLKAGIFLFCFKFAFLNNEDFFSWISGSQIKVSDLFVS